MAKQCPSTFNIASSTYSQHQIISKAGDEKGSISMLLVLQLYSFFKLHHLNETKFKYFLVVVQNPSVGKEYLNLPNIRS